MKITSVYGRAHVSTGATAGLRRVAPARSRRAASRSHLRGPGEPPPILTCEVPASLLPFSPARSRQDSCGCPLRRAGQDTHAFTFFLGFAQTHPAPRGLLRRPRAPATRARGPAAAGARGGLGETPTGSAARVRARVKARELFAGVRAGAPRVRVFADPGSCANAGVLQRPTAHDPRVGRVQGGALGENRKRAGVLSSPSKRATAGVLPRLHSRRPQEVLRKPHSRRPQELLPEPHSQRPQKVLPEPHSRRPQEVLPKPHGRRPQESCRDLNGGPPQETRRPPAAAPASLAGAPLSGQASR